MLKYLIRKRIQADKTEQLSATIDNRLSYYYDANTAMGG